MYTEKMDMEKMGEKNSGKIIIKTKGAKHETKEIRETKELDQEITELNNQLKNSLLDSIFLDTELIKLNAPESIIKAKNTEDLAKIPEIMVGSKKLTDPSFKTSKPGEPDVFEIGSDDTESVVVLGDNVIADSKWKDLAAKKIEIFSKQREISQIKEKISDLKKLRDQVKNP